MKIAIDSHDLPATTRLESWRGMLCDTYMGVDGHFPDDFRSVIEGHIVGAHTLTRITSTRNIVDRSPTLIKRDGLELIFFGILLAGRAINLQGGRETVLERGSVVVSDTSRPFRTCVDEAADIVWLSVPKQPIVDRVSGIEDLVAHSLRPRQPVIETALSLMAGFDAILAHDVPQNEGPRLATHVLDLMATLIASAALPPTRPPRRPAATVQ